eukprot:6186331-Alexandrium_andersonii.AAC.1
MIPGGCPEAPQSSPDLSGAPKSSSELSGALRSSPELSGALWSSQELRDTRLRWPETGSGAGCSQFVITRSSQATR